MKIFLKKFSLFPPYIELKKTSIIVFNRFLTFFLRTGRFLIIFRQGLGDTKCFLIFFQCFLPHRVFLNVFPRFVFPAVLKGCGRDVERRYRYFSRLLPVYAGLTPSFESSFRHKYRLCTNTFLPPIRLKKCQFALFLFPNSWARTRKSLPVFSKTFGSLPRLNVFSTVSNGGF